MGTNIYGSYDSLVIELSGLDVVRAGRREVRVAIDDVWQVRAVEGRALVAWDGERMLRLGPRGAGRVLVLDLAGSAPYDRLVLAVRDADAAAADLLRSGIGVPAPPPALVAG